MLTHEVFLAGVVPWLVLAGITVVVAYLLMDRVVLARGTVGTATIGCVYGSMLLTLTGVALELAGRDRLDPDYWEVLYAVPILVPIAAGFGLLTAPVTIPYGCLVTTVLRRLVSPTRSEGTTP